MPINFYPEAINNIYIKYVFKCFKSMYDNVTTFATFQLYIELDLDIQIRTVILLIMHNGQSDLLRLVSILLSNKKLYITHNVTQYSHFTTSTYYVKHGPCIINELHLKL